jgi:hypothetical protein
MVTEIGTARLWNWCATSMCSPLYPHDRPVYLCHLSTMQVARCCVEPGQAPAANYTSKNLACSMATTSSSGAAVTPAAQSSPPTTTSTITSTSAALLISPLQSTSSVESSSTSTSTSTSSTSLASTALPTSDELFESSPALSQDALIGLIVGVILAALAIIGVVVFVILRRQRRPPSSPSVAPSPARKSEYAAAPSLYNSSQYDVAPGLTSEYDAASSAFVR